MNGPEDTSSPESPLRTERIDEFISGVKSQASDLKKQYIDSPWKSARGYVSENPGKSILMSVAAGVIIGYLLRRRS